MREYCVELDHPAKISAFMEVMSQELGLEHPLLDATSKIRYGPYKKGCRPCTLRYVLREVGATEPAAIVSISNYLQSRLPLGHKIDKEFFREFDLLLPDEFDTRRVSELQRDDPMAFIFEIPEYCEIAQRVLGACWRRHDSSSLIDHIVRRAFALELEGMCLPPEEESSFIRAKKRLIEFAGIMPDLARAGYVQSIDVKPGKERWIRI